MPDQSFLDQLYAEHQRSLLAYVLKLTGDHAQAEDVVQETLLRAWSNPEIVINGKGSVRGWLLTVARHIVIDGARARAARPEEVGEVAYQPPTTPDHAEQVVESSYVAEVLDQLPPEHRAVLTRVYLQDDTAKEAAAALGIPEGTAKSRIYYGLRALRDHLTRPSGGSEDARSPIRGRNRCSESRVSTDAERRK